MPIDSHGPGRHGTEQEQHDSSGATTPVWYADAEIPEGDSASTDLESDVCIVGAGIVGLTCAYLLLREGRSVVVVDEKPVGGGETGRTSAHLASALDDRFEHMLSKHGVDATRLMYESHARAIDRIERIAREESIECGFKRLPGLLFAGEGVEAAALDREYEAATRVQFPGVELAASFPARGIAPSRCIVFPGQARFHALEYLSGITERVRRMGGRIVTGVRVTDLSGNEAVTAALSNGRHVRSRFGIAATNVPTPINNWMGVYTKEAAYRTYVIGMAAPVDVGDALYWDMADPYHYVRLHHDGARLLLLVGGEDHKTGQLGDATGDERFVRLEEWARRWFPGAGAVHHRWSGQVSEPEDGVAFIGRVPTSGNRGCFVITGDSGMGLTHGTLGAMLLTDLIMGRPSPWEQVYDPARKPWPALGSFVRENVNAAAQLGDYLKPGEVASASEIPRGEGAVMRDGLTRLAVYRDDSGQLHSCSAVCPHLKCVVRWNSTEKSWDCPCHGSRFTSSGRLIIGPAVDDLAPHPLAPGAAGDGAAQDT